MVRVEEYDHEVFLPVPPMITCQRYYNACFASPPPAASLPSEAHGPGRGKFRAPDAPWSRRLHPWAYLALTLWLAVICSCSSTGEPKLVDMSAQKIVLLHAEAALEVEFDATAEVDRNALAEFHETIATARYRIELQNAWTAVPALAARGADFLETRIFARAARDGDWPSGAPPDDEKRVYVDPVRLAIEKFLAESEEDEP
jgi:hypothetical protein